MAAAVVGIPPARNRASVAFVLVVVLVGGGLVSAFGANAGSAVLRLRDSGAWLVSSAQHLLTHVNGPSGQPDGAVPLTELGDGVHVNQDGVSVLVTDSSGRTARIDPARLTVEVPRKFGGGTRIIAHGTDTFVVDDGQGTVQRIDPVSLALVGPPVRLGAGLTGAGIDDEGTAWFTRQGQVVPVRGRTPGRALTIGSDDLRLTIAAGRPVVIDRSTAQVLTIRSHGHDTPTVERTTPLGTPAGAEVAVAPTLDSPIVPVVTTTRDTTRVGVSALTFADTAHGTVRQPPLGSYGNDDLGGPVTTAGRAYVPDSSRGQLLVYDLRTGRGIEIVKLDLGPGDLEVFVRAGAVWANDPANANAKVIRPSSPTKKDVQQIRKATVPPKVTARRIAPPGPTPAPRVGQVGGGGTVGNGKAVDPGTRVPGDGGRPTTGGKPTVPGVTTPVPGDPGPTQPITQPITPTSPKPPAPTFVITPPAAQTFAAGSPVRFTPATTGGVAPITWSTTATLPGLALSTDGVLSGTPTTAGTTVVDLVAVDGKGTKATGSVSVTVTRPAADVTGDGAVTCEDVFVVQLNNGLLITGATSADGDVNKDGAVDDKDLALVKAALPAGVTCTGQKPARVTVAATVAAPAQPGVATGLTLQVGQFLSFSATGTTTYGDDATSACGVTPVVGPDGTRTSNGQSCTVKLDDGAPVPKVAVGALLARIGDGPWFLAGTRKGIPVTTAGPLVLGYNDTTPADNTGSYQVSVGVR